MGLFDGLTGTVKEQKTQLFFHDDGSFEFKRREFIDSCLVEKRDNVAIKAWKHFYSLDMPFPGYRNLPAGTVSLAFNRDFILDPFEKVPVSEAPNTGKPVKNDDRKIREWTSQVAESQRYKVMNKPGNLLLWDKITMFLGAGFILELVAFGISVATR